MISNHSAQNLVIHQSYLSCPIKIMLEKPCSVTSNQTKYDITVHYMLWSCCIHAACTIVPAQSIQYAQDWPADCNGTLPGGKCAGTCWPGFTGSIELQCSLGNFTAVGVCSPNCKCETYALCQFCHSALDCLVLCFAKLHCQTRRVLNALDSLVCLDTVHVGRKLPNQTYMSLGRWHGLCNFDEPDCGPLTCLMHAAGRLVVIWLNLSMNFLQSFTFVSGGCLQTELLHESYKWSGCPAMKRNLAFLPKVQIDPSQQAWKVTWHKEHHRPCTKLTGTVQRSQFWTTYYHSNLRLIQLPSVK